MIVQGIRFKTKKALQDYVRRIMAHSSDGVELGGSELEFMVELLSNHPQAKIKIGPGIAAIWVQRNPVYPSTRGFFLRRVDGSSTDFSYIECISETSDEKRFLRACRVAVEPVTQGFKIDFFHHCNGEVWCPYTGEKLELLGSHVHHKPPWTFQAIVAAFVQTRDIDLSIVQVDGKAKDNNYQDTLHDKKLEQDWIDFHNAKATLEVVSRLANLSVQKLGVKHRG